MNKSQKQTVIEQVTGFGVKYITAGGFCVTTNKRVLGINKINEQLAPYGLSIFSININDAGNLTIGIQ